LFLKRISRELYSLLPTATYTACGRIRKGSISLKKPENIKMVKSVKVYSTPTCPYCIRVKQFLKDIAVDFEDIDVSRDQDAAQEMIKRSGQMSVPIIDIDGKLIIGFDKEQIKRALGL
jgi:glutaredoxin-like YruB-family protein